MLYKTYWEGSACWKPFSMKYQNTSQTHLPGPAVSVQLVLARCRSAPDPLPQPMAAMASLAAQLIEALPSLDQATSVRPLCYTFLQLVWTNPYSFQKNHLLANRWSRYSNSLQQLAFESKMLWCWHLHLKENIYPDHQNMLLFLPSQWKGKPYTHNNKTFLEPAFGSEWSIMSRVVYI